MAANIRHSEIYRTDTDREIYSADTDRETYRRDTSILEFTEREIYSILKGCCSVCSYETILYTVTKSSNLIIYSDFQFFKGNF
jgi:hypothetical protein